MSALLAKLFSFSRYGEFSRCLWWRCVLPAQIRRKGVQLGKAVNFHGKPIISKFEGSQIVLGDRCSFCSSSEYTALGVNHPVILRTLASHAHLSIGPDTGISGATICAARKVTIGANVLIGANVVICDTDFHPIRPEGRRYNSNPQEISVSPVVIEDNVFIGTGAMVLKGVHIGKNSVIGAGSIVTKSIPENVVAAGNPAKVIETLTLREAKAGG